MKTSREIMVKAGLYPKLRLGIKTPKGVKATGPHKVRIIDDKIIQKLDQDGKLTLYVRYTFEEDGKKYQYDARMKIKDSNDIHYLVQTLSDVEEGEDLILEMKKAGVKNYIEVTRLSTGETQSVADDDAEEHAADDVPEDQDKDDLADDLATIHA